MAVIRIEDLVVRTIIGINPWEREDEQDIVINITITFDAAKAAQSDDIRDTVDYKAIKKRVIRFAAESKFFLLEKLVHEVLNIVMEDPKVDSATVRIDKPNALRFARSVSMEMSRERKADHPRSSHE